MHLRVLSIEIKKWPAMSKTSIESMKMEEPPLLCRLRKYMTEVKKSIISTYTYVGVH